MARKFLILFGAVLYFVNIMADTVCSVSPRANFSVSSGALNIEYPLELPDGMGGYKPKVSFSYNSKASDGYLGLGWNMTGCQYIEEVYPSMAYDGRVSCFADCYTLNGERLIKTSPDGDTTYFKKAIDDNTLVKRYSKADEYEFIVELPNGTRQQFSYYPRNKYYLVLEKDKNGNVIEYEWSRDPNVDYTNVISTWMLNKISYNKVSESDKVSILLNYKIRANKIESSYTNYINRLNYILDNVQIMCGENLFRRFDLKYDSYNYHDVLSEIDESGSDGLTYNPTTFTWDIPYYLPFNKGEISSPATTHLDSDVKNWKFADTNGDGKVELMIWNDNYVWICDEDFNGTYFDFNNVRSFSIPSDWKNIEPLAGSFYDKYKNTVLVKYTKGETTCIGDLYTKNQISSYKGTSYSVMVADMNNDGYDEIVACSGNRAIITKAKIVSSQNVNLTSDMSALSSNYFLRDFNGDGLLDIAHVKNNLFSSSLEIFQNRGTGSDGLLSFEKKCSIIPSEFILFRDVADFNGDGLPDILSGFEQDKSGGIYYNQGNFKFSKKELGFSYDMMYGFTEREDNKSDIKVGDFNGDGKSDLLFISAVYKEKHDLSGSWGVWNKGVVACYLSTENGFTKAAETVTTSENDFGSKYGVRVFDINRDGIDEICNMNGVNFMNFSRSSDEARGCITKYNKSALNPRIRSCSNSDKSIVSVAYSYLNNFSTSYNDDDIAGYYNGMYEVVHSISINGKKINYEYGNLLYDKTGLGLLGFDVEYTSSNSNNFKTKKTYNLNNEYLILLPEKSELLDDNYAVVSSKNLEFNLKRNNSTISIERNSINSNDQSKYPCKILNTKTTESNNLQGTTTTTIYSDFSKYDLPQKTVIDYGGNLTKTIETTYPSCRDCEGLLGFLPTKSKTTWKNSQGTVSAECLYKYDNNGNLIESVSLPGLKEEMKVSYKLDEYGNILSLDSTSSGISKKYGFTYQNGIHVRAVKNPLGVVSKLTYDDYGFLSEVRSPLDYVKYEYNSLGQLIKESRKDDFEMNKEIGTIQKKGEWYSDDKGIYKNTTDNFLVETQTDSNGDFAITEYVNGNKVMTKTGNFNGDTIYQKNIYDKTGRLRLSSKPYLVNDSEIVYYKTSYDKYGRVTETTSLNASVNDSTRYFYDGLVNTKIKGKDTIITELDNSGRVISVSRNGKTVDFVHEPTGNVISATPQDGEPVITEYNILGKRTLITDPSAGTILTDYDGFGNLLSIKECVHNAGDTISTNFSYDSRGLLLSRTIGDVSVSYKYDEYGRVIDQSSPNHSQSIEYNENGDISAIEEKIDDVVLKQTLNYDEKYRLVGKTSPSGLKFEAFYNDKNRVNAISVDGHEIYNLMKVDENEMPTLEKFGNIVRASRYDKKGMPISDSIGNLMHYEYLFDNQGDMLQKKENVTKQEEVYLFDQHNRLNIWRTFDSDTLRKEISATYDDVFGNLTSRSDSNMVFHYGEFGLSPHALTSVDAPIGSCQNKVNSYSYTDFKMLESASNGIDSIFITYGVDFQRRKMQIFKNDTLMQTRYYFNNYEEEHFPDGRIRKIDYITGPMGLVGVRISCGGNDTLLHAFTDKFGNLVLLADTDGDVVERLAYDPWGARRNPDDWTKADTGRHVVARGYSMHEHLDHLGLINMNARIYDVTTCSFLSPDPLIAEPENWLNYNRYLYCLGNPVKFADPSGMYATWNEAQTAYWNAASWGYDPGPVLSGGNVAEGNDHNYYFTVFSCENGEPTITANFSGFDTYSYYASVTQMYQSLDILSNQLENIESYASDIVFGQTSVATAESATGATASYVGNPVWNAVSNTNNGVAFVVSAANQYVSNALSYSTRYYIEGFSKIAPEIRFQTPVGNFYTTFQAVKTVGNVTKNLGRITGWLGVAMTVEELVTQKKSFWGEGGIDLAMGVVGFIGPYGWLISGVYFGGKMILEYTGNKFW